MTGPCPLRTCEHAAFSHDWEEPGVQPMCCVDGCGCGKTPVSEVSRVQEPGDARKAMFAERGRLLAEHQHLTTAAELAPLMGEHEGEYWDWCLERVLAADIKEDPR